MPQNTKRPNPLVSLLLLAVAIAVGAHVSGLPLFLVKALMATVLVFVYGFFAVRIVTALQIGSTGARAFVGIVLGLATTYFTWAIRIPAFSGWETAFTAEPRALYAAVLDRASSMQVTSGFGAGTSTDGPSWLMLGTYLLEALAFVGVMTLCALLAGPEAPADEQGGEESMRAAA